MTRIFIILSLSLLFINRPAVAAADLPETDPTCQAAGGTLTDYAQRGDDIVLVECPTAAASDGSRHASGTCACHAPPDANGKCSVYACNSDGSAKEPTRPEPRKEARKHAAKKPAARKASAKKPAGEKTATPPAAAAAPKPDKIEYVR